MSSSILEGIKKFFGESDSISDYNDYHSTVVNHNYLLWLITFLLLAVIVILLLHFEVDIPYKKNEINTQGIEVNQQIEEKTSLDVSKQDTINSKQHLKATRKKLVVEDSGLEKDEYNSQQIEEKTPLELSELPNNLKKIVAGIRIHAYSYSEEAGKSFIMVVDKLFHQGDKLDNGLLIQKINLESVTFSFNGYLFKVDLHKEK